MMPGMFKLPHPTDTAPRSRSVSAILALTTAALLAGCSLAPDYKQPDTPVPNAWPTGQAYGAAGQPAAAPSPLAGPDSWKAVFRSPRLQSLIGRSLDNNRDLRVAALNIEVARATYRVQDSATLPSIDAGASGGRSRTPGGINGINRAVTGGQYSVNASTTSYEVDLFGRVHNLSEQALEQFLSTTEARNTTRLSLIAEVATAYLTLVSDRELLHLTQETLATQLASHQRNQRIYDRGMSSQLDLAQSQSAVETARVNEASYVRQVAQDRNALELLVGAPLSEEDVAGDSLDQQDILADLPEGLPADLMLRRPDIREAEHTLKAANANIGVARAAFYPQITLTGSAGTESPTLVDLFKGGSAAWSFAPNITLPLFNNGRNEANLDSAKANRDIAVAQYEKAIQTAFREVADSLAARGTLDRQLLSQTALVGTYQLSYDLSTKRYEHGIDNYLTVLDAQRSLYSAQQNRITTQLSLLSNRVTLFKVLGGSEQDTAAVAQD